MEKRFCEYCGAPLEDGCDCANILADEEREFYERYYNDPIVQAGERQGDLIAAYRMER